VNRPLRRVAVAAALLLLALIVNINVVQVGEAKSLADNPNNHLPLYAEYSHPRGPIVVGSTDAAKSIATGGALKYQRVYPQGPLYAAATGFFSLVYGSTAIEHEEDSVLSGTDERLLPERLSDYFTGRTPQGGSVVLTLDAAAQKAAAQGLAGHRGAVVALNPRTGAILALYSSPSYDPSTLSSHDNKEIHASWQHLVNDPSQPLLDRAISQSYPPGSLFKMVTASTALSSGKYTPASVIPAPSKARYPDSDTYLVNFGGESCGNGVTDTLIDAFRISCNTAFALLGQKLGDAALDQQAKAFGVGTPLSIPMPVAASSFPANADDADTMRAAIGQGDVTLTPMQAAMIAAGIGNGGLVMKPYLVSEVRSPDESVLDRADPTALSRAVTPSVAAQMTTMMEAVVNSGTGQSARINGVQVAGKTGTAQHGDPDQHLPPDAWFAAFAPAKNPQVAVAVIVEDGGSLGSEATGGAVAAPIARSVICAVVGTCS